MARIKRRKNQSLSSLHKLVRKEFSQMVRQTAADWRGIAHCYTCPAFGDWKTMDCGHFRHLDALDFNLKANRVQCTRCNRYLSGNLGVFAVKLIKEIGLKEVEKLNKVRPHQFTIKELHGIRRWIKRLRPVY